MPATESSSFSAPSEVKTRTTQAMESTPLPPPPPIVVRRESVTWPADSPPPLPNNYGSFAFFPPAVESSSSNLLPSSFASPSSSTAAAYFARSPRTDRRLRWRALILSLSTIVGVVACLLVAVILFTPRGQNEDGSDVGGFEDPYPSSSSSPGHSSKRDEDDRPYLLVENAADILLGSAATPTSTTATTTTTTAAVTDPGSPSYPTSAPDNPNIQIPVVMGCMEALCEKWMAAMGKNHGDPANLTLLDCIQRTGMSADGTKTCFANSNVTASPVRMGLYQCAVCKACLAPQSKEEKAALCQTSPSSSSSTAAEAASPPSAPSASDWGQYVPKGYAP